MPSHQTALAQELKQNIRDEDLTKNATQCSINQQIFPLTPERFLSELPEPPLFDPATFQRYLGLIFKPQLVESWTKRKSICRKPLNAPKFYVMLFGPIWAIDWCIPGINLAGVMDKRHDECFLKIDLEV